MQWRNCEGTSKFGVYLPKKWEIPYYEVPYEDLSSSVRVRAYEGLVPRRKLYFICLKCFRNCEVLYLGFQRKLYVICVSHGKWLNSSLNFTAFYTRPICPIMQQWLTRLWQQWRTELHWPGKWVEKRIVNSLFPNHCDGNNWNNHFKEHDMVEINLTEKNLERF